MIGNPPLSSPLAVSPSAVIFTPVLDRRSDDLAFLSPEPDPVAIEESHRGLWSHTLCHVVNYWCAKRKGRRMPARYDIDPLELRRLLPNIYLIDVLGSSRYRYRLVGTTITGRLRTDSTGHFVDESLYGENAPLIVEMYDHVVDNRSPVINRGQSFWSEVDWMSYTSAVLPLSIDGETVTMMMGVMDFWLTPRQLRSPTLLRPVDWEPLIVPAP
jgi:hypothetical protein